MGNCSSDQKFIEKLEEIRKQNLEEKLLLTNLINEKFQLHEKLFDDKLSEMYYSLKCKDKK